MQECADVVLTNKSEYNINDDKVQRLALSESLKTLTITLFIDNEHFIRKYPLTSVFSYTLIEDLK